ncbi:hypothetical protein LX36DRAFT_19653 [Colletotrichum falcatum]|nr:hypothetical protein LX36DRAFT_19653 [Colletotrichum falcatum]
MRTTRTPGTAPRHNGSDGDGGRRRPLRVSQPRSLSCPLQGNRFRLFLDSTTQGRTYPEIFHSSTTLSTPPEQRQRQQQQSITTIALGMLFLPVLPQSHSTLLASGVGARIAAGRAQQRGTLQHGHPPPPWLVHDIGRRGTWDSILGTQYRSTEAETPHEETAS